MHALTRAAFALLGLCALLSPAASASETAPVQWTFALARPAAIGEEVDLIITARIAPDWIVYSSDFKADLGPQPTRLVLGASDTFQPIGDLTSVSPKRKKDPTWDTEFGYFEQRAEFRQRIKVLKPALALTGQIRGQLCNEHNGTCTLFDHPFKL